MMSGSRVLLAGCGDLGTRLGLRLVERGAEVIGVRRNPAALPDSFTRLGLDLTDPGEQRITGVDTLVITLTADDHSAAGYAHTYQRGLEGLIRIVEGQPDRVILVSSTRVLGGDPERVLTEDSPAVPAPGPATILAEVDRRAADAFENLTILRPAGIYGRGRPRLVKRVHHGVPVNHRQWTNRIHQVDLVRGLEQLCLTPIPPRLLHAVDGECVQLGEVVGFIADRLGVPVPADTGEEPGGKRLDGTRFSDFLGQLEFPSYREGYAAAVEEYLREAPR